MSYSNNTLNIYISTLHDSSYIEINPREDIDQMARKIQVTLRDGQKVFLGELIIIMGEDVDRIVLPLTQDTQSDLDIYTLSRDEDIDFNFYHNMKLTPHDIHELNKLSQQDLECVNRHIKNQVDELQPSDIHEY